MIYPGDTILPGMQFFKPLPSFTEWLPAHAGGRRIVDCGAGMGHLEQAMVTGGYGRVVSIDVFARKNPVADVALLDARQFPFGPTDLGVICRPSHDRWIIETIARARSRGAEILYVGLPRNLDIDLDARTLARAVRHPIVAGEDCETALGFAPMDGDELAAEQGRISTRMALQRTMQKRRARRTGGGVPVGSLQVQARS